MYIVHVVTFLSFLMYGVPVYVLCIGDFPILPLLSFFLKYNLRRSLSSRYILAPSKGGLAQKHRRTKRCMYKAPFSGFGLKPTSAPREVPTCIHVGKLIFILIPGRISKLVQVRPLYIVYVRVYLKYHHVLPFLHQNPQRPFLFRKGEKRGKWA